MTPRAYTLRHYPVVGTAESLSCNGSFSSDNQLPLTYITGNPDSIIETKSDGNSTWISVAPKRLHREWISIPRHHRVSLSNHPGNRFPDQLEKAGMAEHASLQETKYLSVDSQVCPGNCYLDPEACKDKVHEALREEALAFGYAAFELLGWWWNTFQLLRGKSAGKTLGEVWEM